MDHELDRLLGALKTQAPDARLNLLEARVWQRVAARTASSGLAGQLQWKAAIIGLALSLGAAFGGAATARPGDPAEMNVFSMHADLAPSTLLDGRL